MTNEAVTVYVVKIEYESGSDNGEVVDILSVHRTEAGAQAAVDDWRNDHGCALDDDATSDEQELDENEFWCPVCGWGADWTSATLED